LQAALDVPESHTTSDQWQSFELRMRQRRVDRCLFRASSALDAGLAEEARSAIDEITLLDPSNSEAGRLEARLIALDAPSPAFKAPPAPPIDTPTAARPPVEPVAGPIGSEPLDLPLHPVSSSEPARTKDGGSWLRRVAALTLLAGAGTSLWLVSAPYQIRQPGPEAAALRTTPQPASVDGTRPGSSLDPTGVDEPGLDALPVSGPTPATSGQVTVQSTIENAIAPTVGESGVGEGRPAPETRVEAAAAIEPPGSPVSASQPATDLPVVRHVESPSLESRAASPVPAPSTPTPPAASPEPAASSPVSPPPDNRSLDVALGDAVSKPPAPAIRAEISDDRPIRVVLNRYQTAYSRLDAQAAADVWPSVDRRALHRAFEGLADQTVDLGRCDIRIEPGSAEADCVGTARWTPRVGGGTQSASRRWRFDLRHRQGDWIIVSARVR
jgi:hypothetical protein